MKLKRCLIIVTAAIMLLVPSCKAANHPPVITSLEAEAERVFPSGSCQIVCIAADEDGDELSYEWSASKGDINGDGATVTWTAPDSEGIYNIAITVTDGRDGEVTDYVTITVKANESPEIDSLAADSDWTTPSHSIQVACNASDPDGHLISYEWTATGGNITGTGAVVNWTAPEEVGICDITVVVNDGHGGSATRFLSISVVPEQPPIIEALLITKDRYGHCYLKKYAGGYFVGKEQKYDIECVVADTDDELFYKLLYEWECDGGELSGEGSMVTWTAPKISGEVTVTVTVSDIAGNMVSKNISLKVVACSSCTFGYCPR